MDPPDPQNHGPRNRPLGPGGLFLSDMDMLDMVKKDMVDMDMVDMNMVDMIPEKVLSIFFHEPGLF